MTLATKFITYSKGHKSLIKSRPSFVPYLGGGMGVKLYLEARGVKINKTIGNTFDFDFTFATSTALSQTKIKEYSDKMYAVMNPHVRGFLRTLPDGYVLEIARYEPKAKVPIKATGKTAYYVIQFRIKAPRDQEFSDFVDCTLAYVPGISRDHLNHPFSKFYGLPIERLKYLHRDVLVVLAGSFVYEGILKRNPLTGDNPEKGLKNTARIVALNKLHTGKIAPKVKLLVKAIRNKKVRKATTTAASILKRIAGKKYLVSLKKNHVVSLLKTSKTIKKVQLTKRKTNV